MMKLGWMFWLWSFHLSFINCQISSVRGAATAPDIVPGLYMERQLRGPFFTQEPPNRLDFLNEMGASITCHADGYPKPLVHWQGSDNKVVTNVDNFRTVLINSTLVLLPFKPAAYRQDIHSATYRCLASNTVGAIRSRDIQVRAVIAQQWSAKVRMIPRQVPAGSRIPLLLKCEVDLMGGGRDFIHVSGWKRDGKVIGKPRHSFYGVQDDLEGRFQLLPNGDLVIHYITHEDSRSRFVCMTRHKLTDQEISSTFFTLPVAGKPLDHGDETNIVESFPAPMMIRQGDPFVLHCYELFFPSSLPTSSLPFSGSSSKGIATGVRWEKLTGNSWSVIMKSGGGIDTSIGSSNNIAVGTSTSTGSSSSAMATMSMFFRQVGSSLVSERSVKAQTGHYRCMRETSKEKIREFDVRVTETLQVTLTINQEKASLESTVELRCGVISSSTAPSITWLKDTNVINPGGRMRLFSPNVLQINQIQKDDQGMYQCLARTDMESAQASVRLELADASPRLIYGFIEQTLAPGPSVSLRCAFSGWPAPKVSWLLDNWAISATPDTRILMGDHMTSHGHLISYLNVSETRVDDGGQYSCKATNRNGSISHTARLNIYGAPWIRMVPPVVAISSEYFTLNCPIAGWPISFSAIVWEKDGQKLPLNQRHRVATNGTLVISLVDKTDAGTYWCSLTDMQGRTARREIQVNVVAPLRITLFPEKSEVVEGERLTLVCTISSGDIPLELRWTMIPSSWKTTMSSSSILSGSGSGGGTHVMRMIGSVGGIVGENEKNNPFSVVNTDPYTSLLKIDKVTESHAGQYFCDASSAAGRTIRNHKLTVFVPPKIEPFSFQDGLRENMMTRLVCGVSQGDLPIQFTWYKDEKPLTKDDPWTNHIEISTLDPYSTLLRISSLSADHAGTYTCLASNPASQTYFSAKLDVQVAPRWLSEPQDINVTRGSESRFDCVGHGIPTPRATWAKFAGEGIEPQWKPIEKIWPSPIAQGISISNGSLIFASVEEVHAGQYMCSVNNGIQSGLSKTVYLHVNVQPYFVGSESQTVSLTLGKTHEVVCEAVSTSPIEINWSKGTTPFMNVAANRIHTVVASDGRKTRSTLVMKDIRSDDSGLYQCTAYNSLGGVSRTFRLLVEEPPGSPLNLRLLRGQAPEANKVSLEWDAPLLSSGRETHDGAPISDLSETIHVPGDFAASGGAGAAGTTGVLTATSMFTTATTTAILAVASPPILHYVLEFSESSENPSYTRRIEIPGEKTQVKVDNLSPASVYLFRVRAINSAGSGPPSEHLLIRTANVPPSVPPNNVRAAAVSFNMIQVSWSPIPTKMSYGRILAYRLVIGTNASEYGKKLVVLVPLSSAFRGNHRNNSSPTREHDCCQKVIHGLNAYTHYEIRVAGINVAGVGPLSTGFSVKTAEAAPASPPRNPQCVALTSHSIQISWQSPVEPNGPVTAYKVLFYPITTAYSTGMSQRVGEIHRTSGLTSVIGGLQPSSNYSFQINPVNIAGEGSEWLNVFCKTSEDIPSPPNSLIGFPSSDSSVYISWLYPRKSNGVLTHHTVYYRIMEKPGDSYEIKRTIAANVDNFEENGLDLTRFKYIFWVTSSNRLGESSPSNQLILSPPPIVETRLVGHSRVVITQPGNSLTLPCRILGLENLSSGSSLGIGSGGSSILPPDSAVSWTLNGRRVGFDGNVYMKPGQSSLSFFGVKKEMMGNYTCGLKYTTASTRGTHSKSTSKKVINGMDHSVATSFSSSSSSTFPAQLSQHRTQLTYTLIVRGPPCVPEPAYELRNRDIYISWRARVADGRDGNSSCDAPLGFILYYRTLGSILDWQKLIFQPTLRNHTLKGINCGAILNMYMLSFNEFGSSGDSPLMSVVVSQQVGYFPPSHELIVPNVSSVLLNLYSLNANSTYCPTEKVAITLKEWRGSDGVTEKDVKFEFRNEFWIDGLKSSTPYEIVLSAFGYSTSRTASFTFTTLTEHGETPSEDVLSTHKVTSEFVPIYKKLKLLVPIAVTVLGLVVAMAGTFIYCQTKRRGSSESQHPSKHTNEVLYGHNQRKSIPHDEQYYSGLPCPPACNPGRQEEPLTLQSLEDISPYATFQISDPKKFCEESFSQEIVVAKFHPVMHGLPRGSRDKWMDRDPRHLQDSEDSESESTQRYSVIPPQRPRLNNTYQISPPQAYHYRQQQQPQTEQSQSHHHHQLQQKIKHSANPDGFATLNAQKNKLPQQHTPRSSVESGEDDASSSSASDLSIPTVSEQRRHSHTKDRRTMKKASKDYGRITSAEGGNYIKGSASSTNLRHGKRKSGNSDYSIAV